MERVIDDVVLSPVSGEPRVWRYRALRPSIAADGGVAQFSLISAAGVHLLSLTTNWGVPAARLEAVRAALAAEAGVEAGKIELRPAPYEVDAVVLRFGDGAGGWEEAARTHSSGMPPYHAVFSLMLDQARVDKLKRALAGEAGWFGVAYAWTTSGGPRTERASTESASLRVDAAAAVDDAAATATFEACGSTSSATTAGADAASGEIFADASAWGIPAP